MNNTTRVPSGFAGTDITPENPSAYELVGLHRSAHTAKGVLHKLKAQVLLFQKEKQTAA